MANQISLNCNGDGLINLTSNVIDPQEPVTVTVLAPTALNDYYNTYNTLNVIHNNGTTGQVPRDPAEAKKKTISNITICKYL